MKQSFGERKEWYDASHTTTNPMPSKMRIVQQNENQSKLTAQRTSQILQQPSTHVHYADESKQQIILQEMRLSTDYGRYITF